MDRQEKKNELAQDTLKLAWNTLLVNLRFLDVALSRFDFVLVDGSLAVDGAHIYYDPLWVLSRYKQEKQVIVRDYLHMVFHCVFHHAFVDTLLDTDAWDLACDIAAENAINELELSCVQASRQASQHLITNTPDSGTAKNKKAVELGVARITEAQFNDMIGRKAAE